ncbi:MAG TPA: dTDP-4-dehydrorhamnose reductase [Candidatus Angelobacter sp.]|nr:dTDP-4-dehydrorhamnose reductase [Candidatus Angelobacter sp.]
MQRWTRDEVTGLSSRDVDIRDGRAVLDVVERAKPGSIVLSAAYTDVDGCESQRELAFAVNRDGAINVARAAAEHGSRLLFLSTDYVFDGTRNTPYEINDPHNPKTIYGQSKSEAEKRLREILPNCCIVRTSWLFGHGGRCFPDTILKLAATRNEIDVVSDQFGCPTSTDDLAAAIIELCRQQAQGVVHVTNQGACSWFDFACEIIRKADLRTKVSPTTSEKFARPAPRPKYSVLSAASLKPYGIVMPPWQMGLDHYLAEKLCQSQQKGSGL